ncbi:Histone-lysine N-methyltransferase pr-set7, partial [Dufourea novaeangliae]
LIAERRKRVQTKSMVHIRTTVLSMEYNDIGSPAKKEPKLDNNINIKNSNSDGTHIATEAHKPTVSISSFSYTQIGHVSKSKSIEESFYRSEHTNVIQSNSVSDIDHFTTDETPVAVPIHGPSTPHRINMPTSQVEDLDEKTTNDKKDKEPLTPGANLETPLKKPANRGRRKLNGSQTAGHRPNESLHTVRTNHKLTDYFPVRRSVRKSKKAVLEEKQRDMENKVLCQVEEGLEVRHFPGKGRGVVTTREFTKGEFVVEYIGELIDQVRAKKREKVYAQDQNTGCYMYYFQHRNHQYCVDATAETDKLGRLVNHSRNGNLVARVIEIGSKPHLVLAAKENIPIGVEITYDYGDRSREAIRHHPWLAL